ncbi:MAG: hypothetical protein HKN23_21210, partial [Verrucomicrobiales bacterium]|nr:hypothetical protein [Verrucomicrobiales bacterium]
PAQGYASAVAWAWILLFGTCVFSIIPILGCAMWLVAPVTIIISVILAITAINKGGTTQGVLILVASLLIVPVFVFIAPIITTAMFGEAVEQVETEQLEETGAPPAKPGWIEEIESPAPKGE